jgi:hypothetical protein
MQLEHYEECAPEETVIDYASGVVPEGELRRPSPAHTYLQSFTVAYEYPVAFTRDLFAPANRVLVDTPARVEPNRRHKLAVFIGKGLGSGKDLLWRIPTCVAAHEHKAGIHPRPGALQERPALVERLSAASSSVRSTGMHSCPNS